MVAADIGRLAIKPDGELGHVQLVANVPCPRTLPLCLASMVDVPKPFSV